MARIRIFFLFTVFFIPGFSLSAQVLEDYSKTWEVAERESWFASSDRISQELNLATFPMANLYLEVPEQTVVFAGEKLWFYSNSDTVLIRRVTEVAQELAQEKVILTLYKEGIGSQNIILKKMIGTELDQTTPEESKNLISIREKKRSVLRDFFGLGLLIVLFFIAFYKQAYPFLFSGMLRPSGLLSDEDFSDVGSLQKFFSMDVLLFVFMVNLLLALVGTLGFVIYKGDLVFQLIDQDVMSLMIFWLVTTVGLLILTVFKFIGIRIVAYLFDLRKLEFPHFFYLLRLIVWACFIMIGVIFVYLMNSFFMLENVLELSLQVFFWLYLIGITGLFLIMMNRLSFKKYHLFTYLCIAELVPFLILAKWIMVLGQ
ncbi:MAG TPA: hypothetical protein DEQ87_09755 [Algoriphagus sp.]|jgi:hypothetical protein|uniref:DUF4271 domain-containing protein n=1 Tax=unclassified Algoriphagus TaxID=2641541 RepID=UPI000C379F23|nr:MULTISPECIES: DUF4271 domain-containing protein [unclassified Algoriphagus]MAL12333.1 hypothetical protein [Algoriphagus sp.]HAD51869.1 hypothetical protein [Algoriphagus sp.]HAS59347.1 hypothetical protein [Algoriphagus sp.]HAZ23870.1 hypothetical protein [Algoriphagus sp.]HCD87910.1 hypothetical protein [Algoriphagus sp.]|tara:strand:- start:654 stop:1769 length:1116 start_codon:yes stop_codon:yes gene_type:complete